MAVIDKNILSMAMPKAMKRGNPIPLDASAVWYSLSELKNYAATNPVAYVGQILSLVDADNDNAVTAYIIVDTAGNIQEVGSATLGDNHSIELDEGVLALKDFGKRFHKYVAATETEEAKYELVEVSESNPWKAGLQPRVDAAGNIAWYEPNPTTIEGVQDQVTGIQGDVEQAQKDIDAVEENLVKAEEKIDSINDTLYGTEGEEAVEGLVDKVASLEEDVADLQDAVADVYTKEEVDGLVSGVFHFKGEAESFEALPPASIDNVGHVYQVGDLEYASNGEEWVELGFVVDLSSYATKTYVDGEVQKVQDALDIAEDAIDQHALDIEELESAVGSLQSLTEQQGKDIVANTALINGLTAVDGAITLLENTVNKNTEDINSLNTQVGDLEALIGAPAYVDEDNINVAATGLYRELEVIQDTIDGIVSVGGEANKIN
jgi:predicted  nucleic acid-binding Zn-ribbon protein